MNTLPADADGEDELPPCVGARYRDLLEDLLARVRDGEAPPAPLPTAGGQP